MWKRLAACAKRVGQVQAWLILTLCYVLVLAPIAIVFTLCADALRLRPSSRSIWQTRPQPRDRWKWAKAQG